MLSKAIEDWLANVSERTFEVPFVQLLMVEGYKVVHLAKPHGPMEQGKDILAIAPDGVPCAFQLKQGDLTLKNWRDPEEPLKGQVEDMLDIPIQHPSIPAGLSHRSFLVTTGNLDETLRQHISTYNLGRIAKQKLELLVTVKGELQTRIEKAVGSFVPVQLQSLRDFLQLFTADGRGIPDKKRISSLLESRTSRLDSKSSAPAVRTTCAELVIMGAHLASPFQRNGNSISEIEVWSLVSSSLLFIAATISKAKKQAEKSLKLVELAIWSAMKALIEEHSRRTDYVEGSPLEDAFVYRARITHMAGYLAAAVLWEDWFSADISAKREFNKFWQYTRDKMWLWGEGAIPSFLLSVQIRWTDFDRTIFDLLSLICKLNKPDRNKGSQPGLSDEKKKGLNSPYVELIDALKESVGIKTDFLPHSYTGHSFALESLVMLLVRRLRRTSLSMIWYEISDISLETYVPEKAADLWKWTNGESGRIDSAYMPQPTSWSNLLEKSRDFDPRLLPPLSDAYPHMLALHLLSNPHRLNSAVALFFDQIKWTGGSLL